MVSNLKAVQCITEHPCYQMIPFGPQVLADYGDNILWQTRREVFSFFPECLWGNTLCSYYEIPKERLASICVYTVINTFLHSDGKSTLGKGSFKNRFGLFSDHSWISLNIGPAEEKALSVPLEVVPTAVSAPLGHCAELHHNEMRKTCEMEGHHVPGAFYPVSIDCKHS